MRDGITGLDHVLIGVSDLEAARASYERLGFTTTPRGRHVGWSTGNYCVMFPRDYIELIGVVDAAAPSRSIERRIAEAGDVGVGFALATDDHEAVRRSLAEAGFAPEPRSLGRVLELPEGAVEPRFALVMLPPEATPDIPIFVCRHLTPELMRRPIWLDHPNTAVAITALLAVVADPGALRAPYERLFGAGAIGVTDDVLSVRLGGATLLVAGRDDAERLYPALDVDRVSVPSIAAMTLTVADLAATDGVLRRNRIRHDRDGGRSITIDPEDACGVLIEFAASPGS
ncbi:MAG: VOC family protein [Alphaproteobacteria bacterium]